MGTACQREPVCADSETTSSSTDGQRRPTDGDRRATGDPLPILFSLAFPSSPSDFHFVFHLSPSFWRTISLFFMPSPFQTFVSVFRKERQWLHFEEQVKGVRRETPMTKRQRSSGVVRGWTGRRRRTSVEEERGLGREVCTRCTRRTSYNVCRGWTMRGSREQTMFSLSPHRSLPLASLSPSLVPLISGSCIGTRMQPLILMLILPSSSLFSSPRLFIPLLLLSFYSFSHRFARLLHTLSLPMPLYHASECVSVSEIPSHVV